MKNVSIGINTLISPVSFKDDLQTWYVIIYKLLSFVLQKVTLQSWLLGGPVGAERTVVRLLSRVNSYVLVQGVFCSWAVGAVCTNKGFLSSVCTNVFWHMIFSNCGVSAVGTLVHLAARSSSAIPRPISVGFHLPGTPNLITAITALP